MRNAHPKTLEYFQTSTGRVPFNEWFEAVRDRTTRNRIASRLTSLRFGNFGDCHSVGGGVFELRFHFRPGHRIYFSEVGNTIVLLLCGGDKSRQDRDIARAKTYWQEYKEEHR